MNEKLPGQTTTRRAVTVVVDKLSYTSGGKGNRLLLDNVSLCVRPGQILAIVGPSGSGKTTLLNAITQRAKAKNILHGTVTFNGRLANPQDIRRDFNYVMTHDKMLSYLTVFETLKYAAALKLPGWTEAARRERIEDLLTQFSLEQCRNTIVGGEWRKGLSSGEMKRLAIACELLDDPGVLILDEPTSGLDSSLSSRVLQLLIGEARRGRTVICTVHQPPSESFAQFDLFLLLTGGCVAYHGPVDRAPGFFACQGYVPAKDWAPCDYYLELVSEVTESTLALEEGKRDDEVDDYSLTKHRLTAAQRADLLNFWETSDDAKLVAQDIAATVERGGEEDSSVTRGKRLKSWGAQWWVEVSALTCRSFINTLRNPLAVIVAILVQAMQGLILGGIFYKSSTVVTGHRPEPLLGPTFWENGFVQSFIWGINGQSREAVHPLLNMWERGIDGQGSYLLAGGGNRTVDHAKNATTFLLGDVVACLHQAHIKPGTYPAIPGIDSLPSPAKWEDLTPQRLYQSLMMFYQFFDSQWPTAAHSGIDLTFTNFCYSEAQRNNDDAATFFVCFMNYGKPIFDPMLACLNLPPLPPVIRRRRLDEVDGFTPWDFAKAPRNEQLSSRVANREAPRRKLATFGADEKTKEEVKKFIGPELLKFLDAGTDAVKRVTECSEPLCGKLMTWRRFFEDFATQTLETVASMLSFSGCLFFVATVLGFASYDALLTFPQERALYNRESANGMYRSTSYYVAKNVADFPFQIVPCFVLVTLFYLLVGFDLTIRQVAIYWLISVLICYAAYGFAYFISALAPRMEVALLVAPLTFMIWLVVAGFFLRDGDIPAWINWFKYLSLYRYAFFALCCNQFELGRYFGTLPNAVNLALSGVTYTSLWGNILLLFALGTLWRVCGFFALHFTNRRLGLEA